MANENNNNNMLRSFIYYFMIALCGIGIIGGFGWMCYLGAHDGEPVSGSASAYVMAVGLLVAAFMVWPVVKELFRRTL